MPQFNLSNASGQELRQLLDSSRRRGDAALTYKILQEMAARREAPAEKRRFKAKRQAAEPQLVAVDLGDPMEAQEDDLPPAPHWRPPPHEPDLPAFATLADASDPEPDLAFEAEPDPEPEPEPEPKPEPPILEPSRPLTLRDTDHEPPQMTADMNDLGLRLHPADPPGARAPRPRQSGRSGVSLVVGFALGIAAGSALGWWAGTGHQALLPHAELAAAPIKTAQLAPRPSPVPSAPAAAVADPAGGPLAAELDATAAPAPAPAPPPPPPAPAAVQPEPAAEPETAEAEPASPPAASPTPAPRKVKPAEAADTATTAASACASQPTPADRQICGDPKLRRLQGELRKAYAEALAAHEDRALLRQHQLEWREARNTVADPARLARLYEERIRKLNAATAEARQQH